MQTRKAIVNNMARGFSAESNLTQDAQTIVMDAVKDVISQGAKPNAIGKAVRLTVNAGLSQYVKAATVKEKAIGAKGFNCTDRGNSRYSATNAMHLHMVTPNGAVKPGTKITTYLNNGLSRLRELDFDVDVWMRDASPFVPQAVKAGTKAKGNAAPKYVGEFSSSIASSFRKAWKENGWNRATAEAKFKAIQSLLDS